MFILGNFSGGPRSACSLGPCKSVHPRIAVSPQTLWIPFPALFHRGGFPQPLPLAADQPVSGILCGNALPRLPFIGPLPFVEYLATPQIPLKNTARTRLPSPPSPTPEHYLPPSKIAPAPRGPPLFHRPLRSPAPCTLFPSSSVLGQKALLFSPRPVAGLGSPPFFIA